MAGAELLLALNDLPAIVLGVLQTLGILLLAVLMTRGVFPKGLAWLGVATGAIGIAAEVFRPWLGWAYAVYGLVALCLADLGGGRALETGSPDSTADGGKTLRWQSSRWGRESTSVVRRQRDGGLDAMEDGGHMQGNMCANGGERAAVSR